MSEIRMLVVDDATFIRDFIRKGLREKYPDIVVDEAVHGAQAQAMLDGGAFRYDVVLCDWEMPELSGDELLAWIRQNPKIKDTPFIMVTSRGEREHVVKAVQAGANSYVVKPFTIDGLMGKVDVVMKKVRAAAAAAPKAAPALAGSAAVLTQGRAAAPKAMPAHNPAAALMGGGKPAAPAKPPAHNPAAALMGQSKAAAPAAGRPLPTAEIRFGGQTVRSVLRDINLTGAKAVIRRQDPLPNLLEPVVMDIEANGVNDTMRMNAFVYAVQAEASLEAKQFQLSIRFADDDPVKNDNLAKFITALRGG